MKMEMEMGVKVNMDGYTDIARKLAHARYEMNTAFEELERFMITHSTVTQIEQNSGAGDLDIYSHAGIDPEMESLFDRVENALGFRLFTWQKAYIERGTFRRYGKTTAEILRDLLSVNEPPIDYAGPPKSRMEDIYRREMRDIQYRLSAAGIPTRPVFWDRMQKKRWHEKTRE